MKIVPLLPMLSQNRYGLFFLRHAVYDDAIP